MSLDPTALKQPTSCIDVPDDPNGPYNIVDHPISLHHWAIALRNLAATVTRSHPYLVTMAMPMREVRDPVTSQIDYNDTEQLAIVKTISIMKMASCQMGIPNTHSTYIMCSNDDGGTDKLPLILVSTPICHKESQPDHLASILTMFYHDMLDNYGAGRPYSTMTPLVTALS